MLISSYSYLCSKNIINRIAKLSNDDIIKEIANNYIKQFGIDCKIDIVWSLISTSLLMSENMFKNSNSYSLINKHDIDEIEYNLKIFTKLLPDEFADRPSLLDSENKPAGAFYEFLDRSDEDDKFICNEDVDNIYKYVSPDKHNYYDELYKKREKHYNEMRIDGPFGCNEGIISNGLLDINKFIKKVRNAIAHSNYVVINSDCIRLYHYKSKDKLDLNITLDIDTIIIIVDLLNEIAYKKFKVIDDYCKNEYFLDDKLFDKSNISDDDLIKFIMNFAVCDINKAKLILKQANELHIIENGETCDNYNIFTSICEVIHNYLKPCCEFGSVINNFLYSSPDGYIISDKLYNKYGRYDYLKSELFGTNYAGKNDVVYKQNELKLLILSYLNCSLLATHNEMENKNISFPKINFSKFTIKEEFITQFEQKHMNNNQILLGVMKQKIETIDNTIASKKEFINSNREIIIKNAINNVYFNLILPKRIRECELEIEKLNQEKENLIIECNNILENGINYNYQQELSNFIFRSLRNSLSHGFVNINGDLTKSFSETTLLFEDYDPNNNQLTFSGKIKFVDLLDCLVRDEVVINLYGIDNISLCDLYNNSKKSR